MHIADGVLSGSVLATGAAIAAVGVGIGLSKLNPQHVPRAAVLSSAFFVASLVHVPLGVGSVHLILNGLTGLALGWGAFPAIFVGLLLQAVLFGFGGLTVLGVNTITMAFPAVCCYALFRKAMKASQGYRTFAAGFLAGAGAVALSGLLTGLALAASGKAFYVAAATLLAAHVPVMLIEGFVTGAAVTFLVKVRPEVFYVPARGPCCEESACV